jgi:hypothetical protein
LLSWKSAEYPWLLNAAKLFKPYTIEDLLGPVKSVLSMPTRVRIETLPAQNWQIQASAEHLRF